MEIRQRVFLMKSFLSEISQLFADSANSGFSIHGNSMAWSSLIYSSGITQFINLLHLQRKSLWRFSYIGKWKVFASPSSHAIPWEEPPDPHTRQPEFRQKHPGKHSSKHIKIIHFTYGLCRMIFSFPVPLMKFFSGV